METRAFNSKYEAALRPSGELWRHTHNIRGSKSISGDFKCTEERKRDLQREKAGVKSMAPTAERSRKFNKSPSKGPDIEK